MSDIISPYGAAVSIALCTREFQGSYLVPAVFVVFLDLAK